MTGYKSLKKETNYFCLQVCLFRKDYGFPSRLQVKQPGDLIPNWLPSVMSTQSTRDPRLAGAAGVEELSADAERNDTAERTLRPVRQVHAKTNSDCTGHWRTCTKQCLGCLGKRLEVTHGYAYYDKDFTSTKVSPKTWKFFFSFFGSMVRVFKKLFCWQWGKVLTGHKNVCTCAHTHDSSC